MLELRRLYKITNQYISQPNDTIGMKIFNIYISLDNKQQYKYMMIMKGEKMYCILQCIKQKIYSTLSILALVIIGFNKFFNSNQDGILTNNFVVISLTIFFIYTVIFSLIEYRLSYKKLNTIRYLNFNYTTVLCVLPWANPDAKTLSPLSSFFFSIRWYVIGFPKIYSHAKEARKNNFKFW